MEHVAGEPVRGSWWSHPKGKAIFAAGVAIEESGEAVACKLFEGRSAWVHRRLWPALARVVTDPGWRAERVARLTPEARALLERVEAEGEVRNPPKEPRAELEATMLVHVTSEHEGRHVAVLRPWSLGPPLDGSLADAWAQLRA